MGNTASKEPPRIQRTCSAIALLPSGAQAVHQTGHAREKSQRGQAESRQHQQAQQVHQFANVATGSASTPRWRTQK